MTVPRGDDAVAPAATSMYAPTMRAWLVPLLLSCVVDTGTDRRPPDDDSAGDTDPTDTDDTGGGDPDLVDVSHPRELRGVWVATVNNIDWPSRTGLSANVQRAELETIVDVAADVGLNAIFFQVRSEGDAMYDSDLEPWSRYLSGTQGQDPGYDPLETLIELAHARGIEVHAWFNPYRARASAASSVVAPHMAQVWPQYAYRYGAGTWMDPGAAPVEDRLVDVIDDVVTRYDVDGIHFDDYFYPYPDDAYGDFPDSSTWNAYTQGGGTLSRSDWRRDNVNRLVGRVHDTVVADDPAVRFGISPFGIYRPGQPSGITGLDQYAEIYADPPHWMDEGWVDYLAPQLYWPHTQTAQAYEPLMAWWAERALPGRSTFAGNYLSKLGTSSTWDLDEFRTQLQMTRAERDNSALGNIWFSWAPIGDDTDGVRAFLRDEAYAAPALPPPAFEVADRVVPPPDVAIDGADVVLTSEDAWVYAIYREEGSNFLLDRVQPAAAPRVTLSAGRWAITAVAKGDVESRGVVVLVD